MHQCCDCIQHPYFPVALFTAKTPKKLSQCERGSKGSYDLLVLLEDKKKLYTFYFAENTARAKDTAASTVACQRDRLEVAL